MMSAAPVNPTHEHALIAAARALATQVDASVLERFARGELELVLAERHPVAEALAGQPVAVAHDALKKLTPTQLKAYLAPTRAVRARPKTATKGDLIEAILLDAYGETYTPPATTPASRRRSSGGTASKSRQGTKLPTADETIANLVAAASVDAAEPLLALGRARQPYTDIADTLGIAYTPKTGVPTLRDWILRRTVVSRLEHEAYVGLGDPR